MNDDKVRAWLEQAGAVARDLGPKIELSLVEFETMHVFARAGIAVGLSEAEGPDTAGGKAAIEKAREVIREHVRERWERSATKAGQDALLCALTGASAVMGAVTDRAEATDAAGGS